MELLFQPKDKYDDVKIRHNYYLNIYYGLFSNIATNMFTYKNLDNILSNDLKKCFFTSYYVGAYKDGDSLLFTPLEPKGEPNVLGDFNEFHPLMYNKSQTVTSSDMIIGTDKTMRTISDKIICYVFANKVADILISIDTAVVDSRLNNIYVGTENEIKDMLLSWENRNIGAPVTVKLANKESFDVKVEQLAKPTMVSDFYGSYRDIINEFMIVIGISTISNPNKKSRMITGEIGLYDSLKSTVYLDKFVHRQKFIKKLNEEYGTEIEVVPNVDLDLFIEGLDKNLNGMENYISTDIEGDGDYVSD